MRSSFFITILLTCLVLTSAQSSTAKASDAPDEANIGFVLYTKSYSPGTLNARWIYSTAYRGPGIATGGPKEGFAGHYHVRYTEDVNFGYGRTRVMGLNCDGTGSDSWIIIETQDFRRKQ